MCWTLFFLLSTALFAQQFEVAVVRRSPPPQTDRIVINLGRFLNSKLELSNVTLSECLNYAYNLVSDAQLRGPDWIKSREVMFDIAAQAAPDTTPDQARLLLQSLLADRLQVKLHREQRDLPHLEMVRGKNGPKMKASTAPEGTPHVSTFGGKIISPRMPMSTLAILLSRFERQIILDKTDLKGFYEVRLEWLPETLRNLPPCADGASLTINGTPVDLSGPSISTAIQDQLGLRLVSSKTPIEVLVIDSATQTPAEN
jgi:uncharacterized protein (TIGR03435 family)